MESSTQLTEHNVSPVTKRAVLLGIISVVLVSVLTPLNNYVLNNSDLVGCYLPTSVLLIIGFLVLVVNPLLSIINRQVIRRGELAVIMAMTLIACAIPAGGLMRYLPGNLVGVYHHAAASADIQRMLEVMQLPEWMFPAFGTETVQSRGNEEVIRGFAGRIATEGGIWEHITAVPWAAWTKPVLTWGVFLLALYGSILSFVFIFRRQWMENERLPFPIASVLSSLIEPPEKGRLVNSLLRSRLFWWAFGTVFILHAFNALNAYNPRWPAVPLKFDIGSILANPPFSYVDNFAKTQIIYFSVIGIACLIESRLAFSLWFFFGVVQIEQMIYGSYQATVSDVMQNDQFFGGLLPYTLAGLWVARHHLAVVARQMLRGAANTEARGRYMPYALAGWVYVGCMLIQVIWLKAAGCTWGGAFVLVLMMGMIFFALTRMIAESGLLYVTFTMNLNTPWQYTATQLPQAVAVRTNLTTNFLSNMFTGVFTHDVRQAFAVYSSTGVAVADKEYETQHRARPAIPFVLCLVGALIVALILSWCSMMYVEYSYASSLGRRPESPINSWGANDQPRWWTLEPSLYYVPPQQGPSYSHSRWGHFGAGVAVTSALTWGRLAFAGFPLHPLGYLLSLTLGVRWVWFSILLGWMLKSGILRLGGASLFRELKPLALGLIIGETVAAAFWLLTNFILHLLGMDFVKIQILLT